MSQQEQFLDVIDRDEAERRFRAALELAPLAEEVVELEDALGRVLARDVQATTNVPAFDRSNYDGFAVRAADTAGAHEEYPRCLQLLPAQIDSAVVPACEITSGTAVAIATGGMVPRGADAVVMVEHCDVTSAPPRPSSAADLGGRELVVRRAVHAGFGIAYAATDISQGETVLRAGQVLSSRDTGVLAAIGEPRVAVWRKPRVAIVSTGDEIVAPGEPMRPGLVYDSNARILADAVTELGGLPLDLGMVGDDLRALNDKITQGLAAADVVILSGGTSKGQGDLSYRALEQLNDPGIVAHGVALKPGKPICLAASGGKPVVILPGFPTSAIFTFHEFVAPVIRALAGRPSESRSTVRAKLAVRINSEVGRTEYVLVCLISQPQADTREPHARLATAFPIGKGSGSVTTFSHADGFITIGRHQEIVAAGESVDVTLLSREIRPADLVVIGSHCVGLDYLLGEMQRAGWRTKFLAVGSTAGLDAARRGECDLAGIHLLDAESGQYNEPFVTPELSLVRGYQRQQGIVYRAGDQRFAERLPHDAIAAATGDKDCVMVNRNQGSGTRILIDRLLGENQPPGYAVQVKNHHAVAAAVAQQRADWGVAIKTVISSHRGLAFLPLESEQYDFVIPKTRQTQPAVKAFVALLRAPSTGQALTKLGFGAR